MQKELSILVPWCNYLIMDVKFRIISYYGRNDGLEWKGVGSIQMYFIRISLIYTLYNIFPNIMLDLSDNELDIKANYCNDLLSMLDVLNCGDCKKRGEFIQNNDKHLLH